MEFIKQFKIRRREARCMNILKRILSEPPYSMSAREVTEFLEMLGIEVNPEVGYAELIFPKTGYKDTIGGWKDPLDGWQLHSVMNFLRPVKAHLPIISTVKIPEQREPKYA